MAGLLMTAIMAEGMIGGPLLVGDAADPQSTADTAAVAETAGADRDL